MDEREEWRDPETSPRNRNPDEDPIVGGDSLDAEEFDAEAGQIETRICIQCGREYYVADGDPLAPISCGKCGGGVFRTFSSGPHDEASADFEESTGRDLNPDDAEGDTLPGDVMDLGRG